MIAFVCKYWMARLKNIEVVQEACEVPARKTTDLFMFFGRQPLFMHQIASAEFSFIF